MREVKKAVILAAGFGTRFLPVTKAVPKEMLPIVDTPSIDFSVAECVDSGITDICIVIARGKECIANYFDRNVELEANLKAKGPSDASAVHALNLITKYQGKANIYYIRQPEMQGTARALTLCKSFLGDDPFVLLFGDDVIYNPEKAVSAQLIDAYKKTNKSIIGVQNMPLEEAIKYGAVIKGAEKGAYCEMRGIMEKPKKEECPSTLVSLGRFLFTSDIWHFIDQLKPVKGEYRVPDAIDLMARSNAVGCFAYTFEGKRHDMGDKVGCIIANIEYGLRDKDLAPRLSAYLRGLKV